jgi:hypothetical protein
MFIMANPERQEQKHQSPNARLGKSIDFLLAMQNKIRSRRTEGLEYLDELSVNESVIIAVSHSTGFDIPLAIDALDSRLNIAIADQSTHRQFGREHSAYLGQKIAGSDNFIAVSYSWHGNQKLTDQFNPQDAYPMAVALENGKSVIIAAHNPLILDDNNAALAPKPGFLAAYLSNLSGHRILPVAVDYIPSEDSRKYDAIVHIGEPFELYGQANAKELSKLSEKRQRVGLSTEENRALVHSLGQLRRDGGTVFGKVQSLQMLELGYPVLDRAYTKSKLGKSALSSPTGLSFPKI